MMMVEKEVIVVVMSRLLTATVQAIHFADLGWESGFLYGENLLGKICMVSVDGIDMAI